MKDIKITDVRVTLCDTRVKGNFADSTRQVETIGFAVVEVDTNVGITGIGVTYHEVGGGRNPMEDVRRVAAVREAIGPDIGFMLDANNVWRAATAIQFANNIREYNIEFFEEPVFADDIPGLAEFKRGLGLELNQDYLAECRERNGV